MDLIMVKLAFIVIGALGLGLWQLYDVNRELRKHDEPDASGESDDSATVNSAKRRRQERQCNQ